MADLSSLPRTSVFSFQCAGTTPISCSFRNYCTSEDLNVWLQWLGFWYIIAHLIFVRDELQPTIHYSTLLYVIGVQQLWVLCTEVRDKRIGATEQEWDETNPQLVGLDVVFHRYTTLASPIFSQLICSTWPQALWHFRKAKYHCKGLHCDLAAIISYTEISIWVANLSDHSLEFITMWN